MKQLNFKIMTCMTLLGVYVAGNAFADEARAPYTAKVDKQRKLSRVADFSEGEDIFAGIFFGVGKAKDLTAEHYRVDLAIQQMVNSKSSLALSQLRSGQDLIQNLERNAEQFVKRVKQEDPTFFERFGEMMKSGDVEVVEKAYTEGVDKIRNFKSEKSKNLDRFEAFGKGSCVMITLVIAEYAVVALIIVVPPSLGGSISVDYSKGIAYYTELFRQTEFRNNTSQIMAN